MLDKARVKIDYLRYKKLYLALQKEVYKFVKGIEREFAKIDVADTKKRIKTLTSINRNIDRPDKYQECSSLLEIKDIAGIRIVCHCEDDLVNLVNILELRLPQQYSNVEKDDKRNNSANDNDPERKSNPLYRAVHFTFMKVLRDKDENIPLFCEIQVRTVMGDAWAVQDRRYIYGNESEGDSRILTNSVAGILQACEGLWSMVKTKYKDGTRPKIKEPQVIKYLVSKEVETTKQQSATKFDADLKNDKL
ncbi:MAG: RelA/SpoT domain-containing protein [Patescibacteria group bacterium]